VTQDKENRAAREQFLREAVVHVDHLYRVAYHLARDVEQVEDLVQETYARAISSYDQFALGSHMKAWLTRILYNLFFDQCHGNKRWFSLENSLANESAALEYSGAVPKGNPRPETYALQTELNSKISEALRRLPEDFRLPIVLVDMEDFSYAEAAEVLSCPIGTIRSRISRGRKLLHKYLKSYVETGAKWTAKRRESS
jgi:RNA polymerase sigma-70 factor, ECF subfamily